MEPEGGTSRRKSSEGGDARRRSAEDDEELESFSAGELRDMVKRHRTEMTALRGQLSARDDTIAELRRELQHVLESVKTAPQASHGVQHGDIPPRMLLRADSAPPLPQRGLRARTRVLESSPAKRHPLGETLHKPCKSNDTNAALDSSSAVVVQPSEGMSPRRALLFGTSSAPSEGPHEMAPPPLVAVRDAKPSSAPSLPPFASSRPAEPPAITWRTLWELSEEELATEAKSRWADFVQGVSVPRNSLVTDALQSAFPQSMQGPHVSFANLMRRLDVACGRWRTTAQAQASQRQDSTASISGAPGRRRSSVRRHHKGGAAGGERRKGNGPSGEDDWKCSLPQSVIESIASEVRDFFDQVEDDLQKHPIFWAPILEGFVSPSRTARRDGVEANRRHQLSSEGVDTGDAQSVAASASTLQPNVIDNHFPVPDRTDSSVLDSPDFPPMSPSSRVSVRRHTSHREAWRKRGNLDARSKAFRQRLGGHRPILHRLQSANSAEPNSEQASRRLATPPGSIARTESLGRRKRHAGAAPAGGGGGGFGAAASVAGSRSPRMAQSLLAGNAAWDSGNHGGGGCTRTRSGSFFGAESFLEQEAVRTLGGRRRGFALPPDHELEPPEPLRWKDVWRNGDMEDRDMATMAGAWDPSMREGSPALDPLGQSRESALEEEGGSGGASDDGGTDEDPIIAVPPPEPVPTPPARQPLPPGTLVPALEALEKRLFRQLGSWVVATPPEDRAEDARVAARLASLQWVSHDQLEVPAGCRDRFVESVVAEELRSIQFRPDPASKLRHLARMCDVLMNALQLHHRRELAGTSVRWRLSSSFAAGPGEAGTPIATGSLSPMVAGDTAVRDSHGNGSGGGGGDGGGGILFGDPALSVKGVGTDDLMPCLVNAILRAQVPRIHSHLQCIARFRRDTDLVGKEGYCFVAVQGALQYLMSLEASDICCSPQEFQRECDACLNKYRAAMQGGTGQLPGAAALGKMRSPRDSGLGSLSPYHRLTRDAVFGGADSPCGPGFALSDSPLRDGLFGEHIQAEASNLTLFSSSSDSESHCGDNGDEDESVDESDESGDGSDDSGYASSPAEPQELQSGISMEMEDGADMPNPTVQRRQELEARRRRSAPPLPRRQYNRRRSAGDGEHSGEEEGQRGDVTTNGRAALDGGAT